MPVARISEFRMHSIGLAELDAIEARIDDFRGHADIAGHQALAHAFDPESAACAARASRGGGCRSDKTARNYHAGLCLAATLRWLTTVAGDGGRQSEIVPTAAESLEEVRDAIAQLCTQRTTTT